MDISELLTNFADMEKNKKQLEQEALQYAKTKISDLIIGVELVYVNGNKYYFEPDFVDSPTFGIGQPFLLVKEGVEYRLTYDEEFERVSSLL